MLLNFGLGNIDNFGKFDKIYIYLNLNCFGSSKLEGWNPVKMENILFFISA